MKRTRFLTKILGLLVSVVSYTISTPAAYAGVMHSDVSIQTYTDFGQNMGRYKVGGEVNALLSHLNRNGYTITYTGGQSDVTLPHGMINYESAGDNGAFAAIGHNFIATVMHNAVQNPTFTGRYLGNENAIHYATIEYRYNGSVEEAVHTLRPVLDYKIARTSKLVTDVVGSAVYTRPEDAGEMIGKMIYRTGSGSQSVMDYNGNAQSLTGAYAYMTGGFVTIQSAVDQENPGEDKRGIKDDSFTVTLSFSNWTSDAISEENPMPYVGRGGDSGSPAWIWNDETQQYEYLCAMQAAGTWVTASRGATAWTQDTMDSFDNTVDLSGVSGIVTINAVDQTRYEESKECGIHGVTAVPSYGKVTDESGNILTEFVGVKSGLNTWKDLSPLRDEQQWYAYGNSFLNASQKAGEGVVDYADLFLTENLNFSAGSAETIIRLGGDVDMGIGYVEFDAGNQAHASFIVESPEGYMLDTSGYIVGANTDVYLKLCNTDKDFMREWRKTGEGNLHLVGNGNNEVFLNLGGSGTTYLEQNNGYAAYNVLANTGAKVVISDTNQIARDFTFGAGGGVLDMNGHSMDWVYKNTNVSAEGFSINALTEEALITNSSGSSTLIFKESGEQRFVGSFADTATGSLIIISDAGTGSRWELNSIHTNLTNNNDSGFIVRSGTAALSGTNTLHAIGSATGTNQQRYTQADDWHYADAIMNVKVANGATFELGSHARLTGDVQVESGGSFVMREGVRTQYEFLEGGYTREDTYQYKDFYGLKGDVTLAQGAEMRVEYNKGVNANTKYAYNISGAGSLSVAAGTDGGKLTLSGNNSQFTGSKRLISGGLIATTEDALGDTDANKWVVDSSGYIAMSFDNGSKDLLTHIDGRSTGVLALRADRTDAFDLTSTHSSLVIGALEGHIVHYGNADKELKAVTSNGESFWALGGGGGELVVHSLLAGNSNLYLGSDAHSVGTVTLTNRANSFSGSIIFRGTGVLLNAEEGTLGKATLDLTYGNGFIASYASVTERLTAASAGMLMVDKVSTQSLDLSEWQYLTLAAASDVSFGGSIILNLGADYRLGAVDDSTLTITSQLDSDRNIVADAQGHSGGRVVLAGNNSWSGNINIMGSRDNTRGSLTLAAGRDMSLSGQVSIAKDSYLDVAGNIVTISNALTGGSVTDSTGKGELVFDTTAQDLAPTASLQLENVRKIGGNTLTLSGTNNYDHLYVDAGMVKLEGNTADSATGVIHLANGTGLSAGNIELNSFIYNAIGSATITNSSTGTMILAGGIAAAEGATLNLTGSGSYRMIAGQYGVSGGTINLQSDSLELDAKTPIDIVGTLHVGTDASIYSKGSATDMERNLEHLCIANGSTATLAEESWNTLWNIEKLSGQGTLKWDSRTNHEATSRLVLKGEGDFQGTIELARNYNNVASTHGAYLELASDQVAKNADIRLTGKSVNSVASLAINTNNAVMKGLSGNEHSYVYAGQSMADAALSEDARPVTTRAASITFDTDEGSTYTYAGQLGQSSDSAEKGLSIVKTGKGTQVLSGAAYVSSVHVLQGTLTGGNMTIRQDVNLACGATLANQNITLGSGMNFNVLAGAGSSATLGGTLTLAGGALSFDAAAILAAYGNNNQPVLSLGGLAGSGKATINFTNTGGLQLGVTYTLASGNWTNYYLSITAKGLEHFEERTFGVNDSGYLTLTLNASDSSVVWKGTDNSHEWNSGTFGSSSATTVIFDDSAANKDVLVTGNVSAAKAMIVGSSEYCFTANGGTASIGTLTHASSGTTTLQSGVTVSGNTTIASGELVVCSTGQLNGSISGNGTLGINWGQGEQGGTLNISDLGTLHIMSGSSFGSTAMVPLTSWDVDNIILEKGATFIQYVYSDQKSNIISKGGTLSVNGGSLTGDMVLHANTELYFRSDSGVVLSSFDLNSSVTDNGNALIQSGAGKTVVVGGASSAVFSNYVIESGTLQLKGKAHSGWGKITVGTDATLHAQSSLTADQVTLNGGTFASDNRNTTTNVVVNGSGKLRGSVNGTIRGDGTLDINNGANINSYINSAISGALALKYTGTGTATVSGMNSYSRGTSIEGGVVIANSESAFGSGAVHLASSATLQLVGNLSVSSLDAQGSLVLNGKTLSVGSGTFSGTTAGTAGNLIIGEGAVTLENTSTLNLNSLSVVKGGSVTLNGKLGLNNGISNSGTVTIGSSAVFALDLTRFEQQRFTIISGDGSIAYNSDHTNVNFTLNGVSSESLEYELVQTNNELSIQLLNAGRDLTWNGKGNAWNTTDANWQQGDSSVAFGVLDNAIFGTDATNKAVVIGDGIHSVNMTISGAGYEFSGSQLNVHKDLVIENGASANFRNNGFDIKGNFVVKGEATLNSLPASGLGNMTVEGTLNLNSDVNATWNQQVEASKGTVNKNGSGSLTWNPKQLNVGTLNVNGGSLATDAKASIGTLQLANGTSATLGSTAANAAKIGEVKLNGSSATIQSTSIHIDKLAQTNADNGGTLNLEAKGNVETMAVFDIGNQKVEGGNFAGTLALQGNNSLLTLSGERAVQHATVQLGSGSNTALGINVDRAYIGGLNSGNSNATIFSGSMKAGAAWGMPAEQPVRTLVIDSTGNNTFAGSVASNIELVKTGSGTQTFSGAVEASTASILGGTLAFTGSQNLTDITLARGATLGMSNLTLEDGKTLYISGTESTYSARFSGNLTLGSGSLVFDGASLAHSADKAALAVSGTLNAGSKTISIDNLGAISTGSYFLMSAGNGLTSADGFSLTNTLADIDTTLSYQNGGLWINVNTHGKTIWNGTTEDYSWGDSAFSTFAATTADSKLIFNDNAANTTVAIQSHVVAESLQFTNTKDYDLKAANPNSSITANSLAVTGSGTVTIGTAMQMGTVSIENGTLHLTDKATLASATSVSLTKGAKLDIGYTEQTINGLTMEAGTTLQDDQGRGTINMTRSMFDPALEGFVNVGTVKTENYVTFTDLTTNSLQIQNGTTSVNGKLNAKNITLDGSGILSLMDSYTLEEGMSITAKGKGTIRTGSVLVGNNPNPVSLPLTLKGGSLIFNTDALRSDIPLLTLNGALTHAEGVSTTIEATDINRLRKGGTYALAVANNWGNVTAEDFVLSDTYEEYVSFTINNNNILSVTVKQEHGVWGGTVSEPEWNNSTFGPSSGLTAQGIAIFDDSAKIKQVQVTGDVAVQGMRFLNKESYQLDGTAVVTTDTLSKESAGEVTINTALSYTDATVSAGTLHLNGRTDAAGSAMSIEGGTVNVNSDNSRLGAVSMTGGTLNLAAQNTMLDSIAMQNAATLSFDKDPNTADTTRYTVNGAIAADTVSTHSRNISIAGGVDVTAGNVSNTHGIGTLRVDGSLHVTDTMRYETTGTNNITGKGSIHADKLVFGGSGTYNVNVAETTANSIEVLGGTVDASDTVNNSSGYNIISQDFTQTGGNVQILYNSQSTENDGTSVTFSGNAHFQSGAFTIAGGNNRLTLSGNSTINNTMYVNGGILQYEGTGQHVINSKQFTALAADIYVSGATTEIQSVNYLTYTSFYVSDGGTLKLGANVVNDALSDGLVELKTGGILDLSNHNFATDSNAVTLNYGGYYDIDGGKLNLGALDVDKTYKIFDSAAISTEWTSLTKDNFVIGGYDLSKMGKNAEVTLAMDGNLATLSYTIKSDTLYWSGSESSGYWNEEDANWYDDKFKSSVYGYGKLTFTDYVYTPDVVVNEDFLADSMTFENYEHEYRFSGKGSIETGSLVLKGGKQVTFGTDIKVNLKDGGEFTMSNGSRLVLSDGASLCVGDGESKGITIKSNTAGENASVSGRISATEGGSSVAITGTEISHALIHIMEGSSLELQDVVHKAGTQIIGSAAATPSTVSTYSLRNTSQPAVTLANSSVEIAFDHGTGTEVATNNADALSKIGLDADAKGYSFTSNAYQDIALTLDGKVTLLFDSELTAKLAGYDYLALSFADTTITTEPGSVVTTYFNGIAAATSLVQDNVFYINTQSVPEPTTATLSILALAALAARRRRK